jgi:hypothetical protein
VLAHLTPSFGPGGELVGYHSHRRVAGREALARITPLYQPMLAEERRHQRRPDAAQTSLRLLQRMLTAAGQSHDEFVWSPENLEAGAAGAAARHGGQRP